MAYLQNHQLLIGTAVFSLLNALSGKHELDGMAGRHDAAVRWVLEHMCIHQAHVHLALLLDQLEEQRRRLCNVNRQPY